MAKPSEIVGEYMDAWRRNDFPTMRAQVADDLDFVGPIDRFDNADAHHAAIRALSQVKDDVVVQKVWADGPDVLVWYELHTKVAPPASVAEWYTVDDVGKVSSIRVVFDARPFTALH